MFDRLFKTRIGVVILSIIWGLGLSTIFKYSCMNNSCNVVEYKAPDINSMSQSIFNYGTKDCYKYKPIISQC
jgi:hypothetical protein